MDELAALKTLSVNDPTGQTIVDKITSGKFPELSEKEITELLYQQFGKIFDRLRNAELSVEVDLTKKAVGSIGESKKTPAELINGKDYRETDREVDRTIVGIFALKWVLAKDYNNFTKDQFPVVKLKREQTAAQEQVGQLSNWDDLSTRVNTWTKDTDNLLALVVALVLGDVGKDRNLGADARERGINIPKDADHDVILYEAIEGGMFDDALNLIKDTTLRNDVKLGIQVGAGLNIPQLAQAECPPGSLSSIYLLKGSDKDKAWNLKFLEVLFDVAGAGASEGTGSARRMMNPVYEGFQASYNELQKVREGKQDLPTAYNSILAARIQLLASQSPKRPKPLSVKVPRDRALTRMMLAARIADAGQATLFENALDGLDDGLRQNLINGLSVNGIKDGTAVLPYYLPGVFDRYYGKLKNAWSPEDQQAVLAVIFRFLSRVFGNTKPGRGRNAIVQVELNQIFPYPNKSEGSFIDPANGPEELIKDFDNWKVQFPDGSGLPLVDDGST